MDHDDWDARVASFWASADDALVFASRTEERQGRLCHQRLRGFTASYGGRGVAFPSKPSGRSPVLSSAARPRSAR
jgi:hypothetical protein